MKAFVKNHLLQLIATISGYLSLLYSLFLIFIWIVVPRPDLLPIFYLAVPPYPNTAICLTLLSASYLLLQSGKRDYAMLGILIVSTFTLLTLSQYFSHTNLGLDNLFIQVHAMPSTFYPGRMFPNTILCILLMSFSLGLLLFAKSRSADYLISILTTIITVAIAMMAILGFIAGLPVASLWGISTSMSPYTAIGVLILSTAILSRSLISGFTNSNNLVSWIPSFGAFILLLLSVLLWQALKIQESRNLQHLMSNQLISTERLIVSNLKERVDAISRMSSRWLHRENTPKKEWLADAQLHLRDQPGYTALGWSDETLHIRWVAPETENNLLNIGRSLAKDSRRLAGITSAIKQKKINLSRSVKLPNGVEGFVLYSPIFRKEKLIGMISAGFDIQKLFDDILTNSFSKQFTITIKDAQNVIYSTGEPIKNYLSYSKTSEILLYGVHLGVSVTPNKEFFAQNESWIATLALCGGIIFSMLLYLVLYLMQLSRKNLLAANNAKAISELSNGLLNGIIESTKDLIAAINKDYQFINFNKAYHSEVFKNLKIDLQLGDDVRTILTNIGFAEDIEHWKRALNGESVTHVQEVKDANGKSHFYELWFSSIINETGESLGAAHVVKDITTHILAEQSLTHSKKLLESDLALVEKRHREVSLLNEMNSKLQSCTTYDQIAIVIEKYSQSILGFQNALYFMINDNMTRLELVSSWGYVKNKLFSFLISDCFALSYGHIYENTSDNTLQVCKHIIGDNDLFYCCLPLAVRNETIGLLYFELDKIDLTSKRHLCTAFAEQVSLVLANLKLREALQIQSTHDPLTNLYNRRYLEDTLLSEIEKAHHNNSSFGVLLIDADYFKKINDQYGHDAGDYVLLQIAKLLTSYNSKTDIACRYGGEEFILCLFNRTVKETLEIAEHLRMAVESLEINHNNLLIQGITISIGIGMYPENGKTMHELIGSADRALYAAKHSGRNKVIYSNTNDTKN